MGHVLYALYSMLYSILFLCMIAKNNVSIRKGLKENTISARHVFAKEGNSINNLSHTSSFNVKYSMCYYKRLLPWMVAQGQGYLTQQVSSLTWCILGTNVYSQFMSNDKPQKRQSVMYII